MKKRKTYSLAELVAQCDPDAPVKGELRHWEQVPPVGLEQTVMEGQVDIREAILAFTEKLSGQYEVLQVILFGSRARCDYQPESDTDIAVILRGDSGDFVETKLAMAGLAFDVLLETGVLIQAFPIWEGEWERPDTYASPAILKNVAREGIIIWHT